MDLDQFKSEWKNQDLPLKTKVALEEIAAAGSHPSIKRIKLQLMIEGIAWILFLFVFYDFFDGHLKPLWLNILLAASFTLLLLHHIWGIRLLNQPMQENNLITNLESYKKRLSKYTIYTLLARGGAMGILFLFFFYNVEWTAAKYGLLMGALFIMLIQFYVLYKIWARRIQQVGEHLGANA